jgi:hypothetical protein
LTYENFNDEEIGKLVVFLATLTGEYKKKSLTLFKEKVIK